MNKSLLDRIIDFYREFENANIAGVLARKSRTFNRFLNWWLGRKRRQFLSSKNKEELNEKLVRFLRSVFALLHERKAGEISRPGHIRQKGFLYKARETACDRHRHAGRVFRARDEEERH